jgi:hypothetical protein
MICAIHQPQYLPWLGYFDKMARADVFVLLDDVQFKKNEWQNRNRIRDMQGWQWITVPVLHDHGQLINQVKLNPSVDWRGRHVRAIELNYKKAPFFSVYWPRLKPIYEKEWATLGELNIASIRLLVELLGITTRIVVSSDLAVSSQKTQRLIDICRAVECDRYLAGAGCADYMDFDLIKTSGLSVDVQAYTHPVYPQIGAKTPEEFYPYMSTLDLLMNVGERSLETLRGIMTHP